METSALTVNPVSQHLGKIRQHAAKTFEFSITNKSREKIEITDIDKSCGCTEVRMETRILQPGQSATLEGSLAAQDRVGEFSSILALSFHGATSGSGILKMAVGARSFALLEGPTRLDLGEGSLGEAFEDRVFSFKKEENTLEWDELRVGVDRLKYALKQEGDWWQLTVCPSQVEEVGSYQEELRLELWKRGDSKPVQTMPIMAAWKIRSSRFQIIPSSAYIGELVPGGIKTVRMNVKHRGGKEIRLEKIEMPKNFTGKCGLKQEKENFYLEIQATGAPSSGGESGVVRVTLSDGHVREVFRVILIGKTT